MAHLADWADLLVRWVHLIAGIAWIGSSFYFIWLDSHLTAPAPPREGVEGELWMVHSGGFYRAERRLVGPGRTPAVLHWFKWEALLTGASGLLLLVVVYYLSGGVYLLPGRDAVLTAGQAAGVAAGLLVAAWFVYDALYRSRLARTGWPASAVALLLLAGVTALLTRVLSGRAAFIHVGAMLGVLMVANVWVRILPAQQTMLDATAAGREPDLDLGAQAKQRSVHNSYLTFPVLFLMISSHFPATYAHPGSWLVLLLLIAAGAGARYVMIGPSRHRHWVAAPVAGVVLALMIVTAPRTPASAGTGAVTFAQAREVINQRCLRCHSAWPTDAVFTAAPNGVTFDKPATIRSLAARIRERAVVQQTMPLANQTGITAQERALLGRWVEQGARIE